MIRGEVFIFNMIFHGVDIVEIKRIEEALHRWGDRFIKRIYREREGGRVEELAVRFAAKEAVIKALGRKVPFRDIEILNDRRGKPFIKLHGRAQKLASELKIKRWEVSLSHSREMAIASVIGVGDEAHNILEDEGSG